MINYSFLFISLITNPEFVIRYYPIIRKIKQRGIKKDTKILDIGGGDMSIGNLVDSKTTVLDVQIRFSKFSRKNIRVKIGSVLKLPFKDNSFPCVVSIDMLEHIPTLDRKLAIQEMVRVTNGILCLSFPSGEESFAQDKYLQSNYVSMTGNEHVYFKEHLDYGLPVVDEVITHIHLFAKKYNKNIESIVIEQNFNTTLRKLYMILWIRDFTPKKALFRMFGILCFILNLNSHGYRKTIYVEINSQ